MKRTNIGIYGRESEYIRKLASYIRKRSGDSLEVKAFTEKEALRVCLENGGLDCVLVESDAAALCTKSHVWTAVLSEGGTEPPESDIPYIGKYQSAEQIWKQLLKFGDERLTGIERPSKAGTEAVFIGVASPVHGCGKTSLGLCISRFLAEWERTLFLTLDEFSCLPEILGEGGMEAELSELYYYYSQGELSGVRIQSAVCRWGAAEYLVPAGDLRDLYREGQSYETEFFRSLAKAGAYRYVVLDVGNSLFAKEKLLGMCDRLYLPDRESSEDLIRMEHFLRWLERLGISERAVRCRTLWEDGDGEPLRLAYLSGTGETAGRLLREDGFLPKETG